MAAGKIYINGTDIRATYNADVFEMPDAPTPAMRTRVNREYGLFPRPKRVTQEFDGKTLTLRFFVTGATQDAVVANLVSISNLCGVRGGGNAPVSVKIFNSGTAGVDSTSVTYVCILESFDVEPESPIHVSTVAYGTLRFAIIDIQSTAVTTQSAALAAASGLSSNYYFTDTNCTQGSTPIKIEMTPTVQSTFNVTQLAAENELIYSPQGFTKNGNVIVSDGQYGFPSARFEASGASLQYSANYTLALGANMYGTIVVRFKRNYATNDASTKYLFQCSTTPLSLHLAATTQLITLTFPLSGGGTSTVTLDGSTISNSAWNTIIVHLNGTAVALYLTVGVTTTSAGNSGANQAANGTPGGSLYIGNSAAGTSPCKSYISEFAIYTHNLTAGQLTALQTFTTPIADNYQNDLNRNLTFLLDFSKGFSYRCNRGNHIESANAVTSTEKIVFDSFKQTLRLYTTTSGASNEISGDIVLSRGYGSMFTANLYNKFMFGVGSTGTTTYRLTYEARGRW